MHRIVIPYTAQSGTLTIQNTEWPHRCACCGRDNESAHYHLEHRAEVKGVDSDRISFYPLSWQVPYCPTCLNHVRIMPKLEMGALALGGLLWLGLGYLLFMLGLEETAIGMVIFLLSLVMIGFGGYKAVGSLAKTKMTPACSKKHVAVEASSSEQKLTITFHNDDYGAAFALLNTG